MQAKRCVSYLEDGIVVSVFGGTEMPFPWQFGVGIKEISLHLMSYNVIWPLDLAILPQAVPMGKTYSTILEIHSTCWM